MDADEVESLPDAVVSPGGILEPCLICGMSAKGLHFQVNSCRACAAFFRRSVRSKVVYRCQRGIGNCDVTQKIPGKPLCRYCRLKKCVRVGMSLDTTANNHSGNWSQMTEIEGKRTKKSPDTVEFNVSKIKTHNHHSVAQRVRALIADPPDVHPDTGNNMLERFSNCLAHLLEYTRPKGTVTNWLNFTCAVKDKFYQQYVIEMAQLTQRFDYFSVLNSQERLTLFKHFWHVFHHVERIYQTVEFAGDDLTDTRMLIDDRHSVDINTMEFHFPDKTPAQTNDINKFFSPFKEKMLALLMPMKKLKVSRMELSYISHIIFWSCFELDDVELRTHELADKVICHVSEELHEYYVKTMRITNYASRQAALFKLMHVSEYMNRDKKMFKTMNRIFNVIGEFPETDDELGLIK